jgi:isopenicillin N synthase-like dioxygenase
MGSDTAVLERPSLRAVADGILARGFAEMDIDTSILAEHLPVIKRGMREMTDDPSVHDVFAQQILGQDEMGWDQEAGLVLRNDKERKFFFHYQSPPAQWPFPDQECVERFSPFLESCAVLTAKARSIVRDVARELDAHPRLSAHRYTLARALEGGRTLTRVLRYLPREGERAHNADAYAHLDRSFMTIHWWASAEGLLMFDREGVGHRVAEGAWDRIAIFPGKKFFGLTDGVQGMSGIHGVRDSRTERTEDRIAVVTFVHADLSPAAVELIHNNRQAFKDAEERCAL